jgi:mannitol/fructose-specific phosphotransferase system IIA component (Ntr-type)
MEKILPEVCLEVTSDNKKDALRELADLLFKAGKISDLDAFVEDLESREKLMSTYCGYHLAIPHSASDVVEEASFVFGRSKGMEWDEDDDLVKFIIILAIPKSNSEEDNLHIDMMSSIATLALEDEIRMQWEQAQTVEDIIQTFNQ